MAIKILLADDDGLIRESLKIILECSDPSEFEVVGVVENGLKAVEFCKNNLVDVAVLDIRMPILNGVDAVKEIRAMGNTKTLILTTFDDDDFIMEAMRNGASGYILKNNSPDKIREAIKAVHGGNSVLQDVVMEKIREGLSAPKTSSFDKSLFSQREVEIIQCIAEGLSNKEISQRLFLSEGTVKNYISTVLNKTGLEHRTQIAIYYLKQ